MYKKQVAWFGEIQDSTMRINNYGEIVLKCWNDLPKHYQHIQLTKFVIMPNHIHGIITINVVNGLSNDVVNGLKPFTTTKTHGLSEIIRGFKTFSSRGINLISSDRFQWQKSFYDRIIRSNDELLRIEQYIVDNPVNWEKEEQYIL